MSPDVAADICRVTVVGPRTRVDLALPVNAPFAELFPGIAHFAGLDAAAIAGAPEGWSLQRLGEPPFEPPVTPAQAGVADGELLYLRPWLTALPVAVSDDIADDIAGVHDGPGQWGARDGRRVALGAGAAALAAGVVVLLRAGPPWPVPAMAAGLLALLLLAAGAAVSRAAGDAGAGAVLGYAALPYAFAAGVLAPLRMLPLTHVSALAILAGFALVMTAALIAATAIAHGMAVFFGLAGAAAFGIAAAGLAYLWPGLTAAGAAGLVVTPALALTPLIPAAAFRLARLPLPAVPASADDLRDDTFMAGPGVDVRSRALAADRFVTGAVSGLGLLGRRRGDRAGAGPQRAGPGDVRRAGLRVAAPLPGVPWPGPAVVADDSRIRQPRLAGGGPGRPLDALSGPGPAGTRRGHRDRGRHGHLAAGAPAIAVLGPGGGYLRHGPDRQPRPAGARGDGDLRLPARAWWMSRAEP